MYKPTRQEVDRVLKIFAAQLKELIGDKLDTVILFGSYARGDYKEGSDVDVMILLDVPREMVDRYSDFIRDLSWELGIENNMLISAIEQSKEFFYQWKDAYPFYNNVLAEGVRISA